MSVSILLPFGHGVGQRPIPFHLQVTNTTPGSIAILGVCLRSTSWEVNQENSDISQ